MTTFVVIFLCLIALVLILGPLVWRLSRENSHLGRCLNQAQKDMAETLRRAEHYRLACEDAPDGILIQDMRGRIIWSNPAYGRIHGYGSKEILGRNPLEFVLPQAVTPSAKVIAAFRYDPKDPAFSGLNLYKNQHRDGSVFWNQVSVSFRRSANGQENAIQVCRDVTEQVKQEKALRDVSQRLEHEATHDSLTCVPNRAAFLAFMDEVMRDPACITVGLLHIDLDNFKAINDTHGHSAGDAVLVRTATALRNKIRATDMVARVGGDEFVVICPDVTDLAALGARSKDLIDVLSDPFEWSNRILQIEASVGAAFSDCDSTSPDALLLQSDFALYEAKRSGRNRSVVYDEALHARHTLQIRHAAELADAIGSGSLDYYFQPTMSFETQEIVGLETLVRWIHPTDGVIAPDNFLPMVKDLGLMGQLDMLSMAAALAQKRRLNRTGLSHISIAFNASPELLAHPDFVNRLVWGVEAGGIDRAQVTIEVLETTDFGQITETSSHASIINDLRKAGFQVHLDDFGIGFAGLSHLASLNVSGVKIDRSLIRVLLEDETSRKIVRKIIELSNDLGLAVIAEGVDDVQVANALHAMGCSVIQGYWLSRPLPREAVEDWLDARKIVPLSRPA